ncbi:MAG: ligand-binding sensor domain-containing protein [Salibacteraceae bacterium]|jgi:ligand-binding sensor domain-containing protein
MAYLMDILSSMQDSKGFIWISTGMGLYRYDGTEIIHFGSIDGLPSDVVFEAIEDFQRRIWVRIIVGEFYRYLS